MTNDNTDLDKLELKLNASVGINNAGQAERDRDLVKTGALLSIARSLESTRVPDHWEALESPSGAILGWFDPQVARTIAQALAASQGRQQDADDVPLPIEVGSIVVLTEALELAGDDEDAVRGLTMGQVLELGVTEDEPYAVVAWLEDGVIEGEPGKVWVSALTALEQREAEPVEREVDNLERERVQHGITLDDESAVLNGDDLEPEDDIEVDSIDADFDTVVEPEPVAPVDPLTALKGKTKGKGKRAPMFGGSDDDGL